MNKQLITGLETPEFQIKGYSSVKFNAILATEITIMTTKAISGNQELAEIFLDLSNSFKEGKMQVAFDKQIDDVVKVESGIQSIAHIQVDTSDDSALENYKTNPGINQELSVNSNQISTEESVEYCHTKFTVGKESGNKPGLPIYRIHKDVFDQIYQKIGKHKPELGGMLGGSRKDRTITHFYFDSGADTSAATYSPNASELNSVLFKWNDQGIDLVGFIHSHPNKFIRPSYGDEIYAKKFLDVCKSMDEFFMPIVQTDYSSGGFALNGFAMSRHASGNHRVHKVEYEVVDLQLDK